MFRYLLLILLMEKTRFLDGATVANLNLVEYQELCKFIQILETPPEVPGLKAELSEQTPFKSAEELLGEIELLQAATLDDPAFALLEKEEDYKEAEKDHTVKQIGEQKWKALVEKWIKNQKKPEVGAAKLKRPPNRESRQVAQVQISKILSKADGVALRVKSLSGQRDGVLEAARVEMLSAIYGNEVIRKTKNTAGGKQAREGQPDIFDGVQPDASSFSGTNTYVNVCGGDATGGGEGAGKSILSDMVCLCAGKNVHDSATYCGTGVNGDSLLSADFDAAGLVPSAKKFKGHCKGAVKSGEKVRPTPESLNGIVARFRGLLGKNSVDNGAVFTSEYQTYSQAILGAFVKASNQKPKCDGVDGITNVAQTGICVNYGVQVKTGQEIPWVNHIHRAAEHLKQAEAQYSLELALLSQMETLKNNAEIYYESALNTPAAIGNAVPSTTSSNGGTNFSNPLSSSSGERPISGGVTNSLIGFIALAISFLVHII